MSYIIGFPHTSVFLVYQIIPALKYNASCTQFSLTYLSFYQSRYFIHIFLISDSIGWCKSKLLPLCHTRLKKNRVNPDILLLGSNIQHGRIKRCLPADTLIGFKWHNSSHEPMNVWAGVWKGQGWPKYAQNLTWVLRQLSSTSYFICPILGLKPFFPK